MTGAPVPEGVDAVLMVEHAEVRTDGLLYVLGGRTLQPGENVVAQGAEARVGAEKSSAELTELQDTARRVGFDQMFGSSSSRPTSSSRSCLRSYSKKPP